MLRVHPRSLGRIAKLAQHQADSIIFSAFLRRVFFLLFLSAGFIGCFSTGVYAGQPSSPQIEDKINEARELLVTYDGEKSSLTKIKKLLEDVLKTAPQNPQAKLLMARFILYDNYLGSMFTSPEFEGLSGDTEMNRTTFYNSFSLGLAHSYALDALNADPAYAEAFVWLAHIELQEVAYTPKMEVAERQSELDRVPVVLKKAEELGSTDPWKDVFWAEYYGAAGNEKAALERFNKILNSMPADKKMLGAAYDYLIGYNEAHKNYSEVDRAYQNEFGLFPSNAPPRDDYADYLRGVIGNYDKAMMYAVEATHLINNDRGKNILARCIYAKWAALFLAQRKKEAETYFKMAQDIEPDLDKIISSLGWYSSDIPTIRALMIKGISINAHNGKGISNIINATNSGKIDVVKKLLSLGADPNSITNDHWTPLLVAADHGYIQIATMLLEKGADPSLTANGVDDALAIAEKRHNKNMCDLIKFYIEQEKTARNKSLEKPKPPKAKAREI